MEALRDLTRVTATINPVTGPVHVRGAEPGDALAVTIHDIEMAEHGWFGCDPTSGEGTSKKHIVTGVSSHPRGVMPVSGVYSEDPRSFVEMNAMVKISPMA